MLFSQPVNFKYYKSDPAMRRISICYLVCLFLTSSVLLVACKDDAYLATSPPLPDASFKESFDTYQDAYDKGWRAINKSNPIGIKWYDVAQYPIVTTPNYMAIYYPEWNQAQYSVDENQGGSADRKWKNAYQSQNTSNGYVSTSAAAGLRFDPSDMVDCNSWLVSPVQLIKNGDKIIFYTYCEGLARLQLYINSTGTLNVGTSAANTGDFTIKLLDINAAQKTTDQDPVNAYPKDWTRFEAVVSGLEKPVQGRFAFRYFVNSIGGITIENDADIFYTNLHKTVIGIDEVSYVSAQ